MTTRWEHLDGQGAVCLEADGSVRLFVNDDVADLFAAAELAGVSADDLVNQAIDAAEREPAQTTVAPTPQEQPIRDDHRMYS